MGLWRMYRGYDNYSGKSQTVFFSVQERLYEWTNGLCPFRSNGNLGASRRRR